MAFYRVLQKCNPRLEYEEWNLNNRLYAEANMQEHKKQYTMTITGKAKAGFVDFIWDLCKALRVPGIVYNSAIDEIKLFCEADQETISKLTDQINKYKLEENRVSIQDGLQLPERCVDLGTVV